MFLFLSINLLSQSLATNILFEQANVVYKGKVEKISYNSSNGEGDDFGVSTIVEEVYKNNFYGEKIGIRIKKVYEYDTIANEILMNWSFQIKEGNSYIFFIQKTEEFKSNGRYIYFANLAENDIEGIPFSDKLESEIKGYHKSSYLKTHNYGQIPFKILFQSSPRAVKAKVKKIKRKRNFYLIYAETESEEKLLIKTEGQNCICVEGKIKKNEDYLFFLTPYKKGKYLLTDKWLGVFQTNSIHKNTIENYLKKKTAANNG